MLWASVDSILCAWRGPSLFVADRRGECGAAVPVSGYYFRETRYLRALRLTLNREAPWWSASAAPCQNRLSLGFTYPELTGGQGGGTGTARDVVERDAQGIARRALDLRLEIVVAIASLAIRLQITNHSRDPVEVGLDWAVDADFADLQEAFGERSERTAHVERTAKPGELSFLRIEDDLVFGSRVTAGGPVDWQTSPSGFATALAVASRESVTLGLVVIPEDPGGAPDEAGVARRERRLTIWNARVARLNGGRPDRFGEMVNRSLADLGSLALLEGSPDEWLTPAAGIPMYPALFARDALTAGWQSAAFDQGAMLDATLTRVRRLQGRTFDPSRDEEPGRIVQQVRAGPLARLGHNPFGRYYGDVASPFMFVISLGHLFSWTGDRAQLARHFDAARRVLDWALTHGDQDGDGYVEYLTRAPAGPTHQGWKDSGDAVLHEDGSHARTPIAAAEVQGYWYAALQIAAVLSVVLGHRRDGRDYWRAAADLKERFNRDFWMKDLGFVAQALDADKRPVRSIASNAGHCLASGILTEDHLRLVAGRLFAPDMFSGWGIRTLSMDHPAYNPVSYHLGSIWAVENAVIAFGLRRFGLDQRALDLAGAMFELAHLYTGNRVPECIGGHPRGEHPDPGAYPRANSPQAWNLSAFPLLAHTLLGLQPVAPLHLLVVDPALPAWLPEVTLERLRVGEAMVNLRFYRDENGHSHAEVTWKRGKLRVVRQQPPESVSVGLGDRFRALVDGVLRL